ncbi:MAG: sigma-54-dependent Fis family transcriptional regulator [Desulfobulbaceae bacterium]|nr:sigma-54-dependent Fis family transcriptional regulator [Desulfobulbaceae bacterium]
MSAVLIVDDQDDLRFTLSKIVEKQGYSVTTAASGADALDILRSSVIDMVFLDIGLPDGSGIDLIHAIKEIGDDIDIVMLSGINEAKTAVESLRAGAVDYIVKPFDIIEFKAILNRILQARLMGKRATLEHRDMGIESIIGSSPPMIRVKKAITMGSEVDSAILITGETGTGKELTARAIHESRPGQKGVFVKVDCGTLSSSLIESELFGYEKGAFTDASRDKKGLVEVANGGTLFLDEIGNLPIQLQPKLLRLIEESTFRRVGGLKDIQVKIRIIAATNVDIEDQIVRGTFREDLYYRLNVIPIPLPPLRDRGEDILLLADFFLHDLQKELKKNFRGFTPEACTKMLHHDWQGNIRELRNLIEREVIFTQKGWISLASLTATSQSTPAKNNNLLLSLRDMEQQYIKKVLNSVNNNKSKAARILGISRTTLRDKL